jgi:hypothetical protein
MKKSIALFGLLGLIGCFLPLAPHVSWFDFHSWDWLVWLVIAAFAVPMLAGLGASKTAVASVVGCLCFGYILFKFGTGTIDLVLHASIGGKMMAVGAIGGLASSLLGFAERKE